MITVNKIIGSEKNEYSLVNLITDVKAQSASEPLYLLINSPGGDGELAFNMYDYLRGLNRQIITESTGMCASAASILFLSGDRRIAGCPIMIHNPFLETAGDKDVLRNAADWIEKFEKRVEKFYSKITKLDETALSSLMNYETYIAPSDAVKFGFATEAKQIAKAFINPKKSKTMGQKKELPEWRKKMIAFLQGDDGAPKMLDLTATDGTVIVIDRTEGEPQVGDPATPDGTFIMPDGTTIVIADGVITEITPPQEDAALAELRAENEKLQAEIATMKEEKSKLEATAKTTEEIAQLNAIKIAGGTEWLEKKCSHYKPSGRASTRNISQSFGGKTQAKLQMYKEKLEKERGK